jgi:hypothetical protein
MKHQKSCGPHWGKLVHLLSWVVTFVYNLCLGNMIGHWKGIDEDINLLGSIILLKIIEMSDHEKK